MPSTCKSRDCASSKRLWSNGGPGHRHFLRIGSCFWTIGSSAYAASRSRSQSTPRRHAGQFRRRTAARRSRASQSRNPPGTANHVSCQSRAPSWPAPWSACTASSDCPAIFALTSSLRPLRCRQTRWASEPALCKLPWVPAEAGDKLLVIQVGVYAPDLVVPGLCIEHVEHLSLRSPCSRNVQPGTQGLRTATGHRVADRPLPVLPVRIHPPGAREHRPVHLLTRPGDRIRTLSSNPPPTRAQGTREAQAVHDRPQLVDEGHELRGRPLCGQAAHERGAQDERRRPCPWPALTAGYQEEAHGVIAGSARHAWTA